MKKTAPKVIERGIGSFHALIESLKGIHDEAGNLVESLADLRDHYGHGQSVLYRLELADEAMAKLLNSLVSESEDQE